VHPEELPSVYEPVRPLGRGGMGEVWEVRHRPTGVRYALKRITDDGGEERLRFAREAQAAASLDGRHVVRVHAAEFEGPRPYVVQELMPGGSLADRLKSGPLPPGEARRIALEVAAGLGAAHARGVLHRDLKPGNVLFTAEGAAKVADFGLAWDRGEPEGDDRLTRSGVVLGTPSYMAPEQALDPRAVDERADVYALGAVLYAMLTGGPPIPPKGSAVATLAAIQTEVPLPPSQRVPGVGRELDAVCQRALEKEPTARFPSAAAFAEAVAARPPRRRVGGFVAGALVVALGLAAVLAASRGDGDGRGPAGDPDGPPPAGGADGPRPGDRARPAPSASPAASAPAEGLRLPLEWTARAAPAEGVRALVTGGRVVTLTDRGAWIQDLASGADLHEHRRESAGQPPECLALAGSAVVLKWDHAPVAIWRPGRAGAGPERLPGSERVSVVTASGDRIVAGDYDGRLRVFDASGRLLAGPARPSGPEGEELMATGEEVRDLAFVNEDLLVVSASRDRSSVIKPGAGSAVVLVSLRAWLGGSRRARVVERVPLAGPVAVAPGGGEVIVGTTAGTVHRYGVEGSPGRAALTSRGGIGGLIGGGVARVCVGLAFTPDGRALVVAYGGRSARQNGLAQFAWPGGDELASWDLPSRPWTIAPGPSGERVLVAGEEGLTRVIELVP